MNVAERKVPSRLASARRTHERTVLVLQGGGALGAYQAGVYEGLAEAGMTPDWVAGVSIGAINAALIAGNPPDRRVERLRAFWDRVSSMGALVSSAPLEAMRPILDPLSAAAAATFGIPGFFAPRLPTPFFASDADDGAPSVYDTKPLRATLEELVDFDLINRRGVRLSLGAVNVRKGNSIYFDNHKIPIGPDHVRASGSLPPGFPSVTIDGEHYWDGGIVSNTPLWYVLDTAPRVSALIFQVDLFSAQGEIPGTLGRVLERTKDIQYSSKTRFNTKRVRELADLRATLGRVLAKLPSQLTDDADVKKLTEACRASQITIVHLINRRPSHSAQAKDCEFSRTTVNELWDAGRDDAHRAAAKSEWVKPQELWEGMRIHELTRSAPMSEPEHTT